MSQKAFDKVHKDIVDAKAAIDLLLVKRRSLMETLVMDLTPKESFDMRLEQLLLEYPNFSSDGRQEDTTDDPRTYEVFIEDCKEEEVLDRLNDPRYNLSSNIDCFEVSSPESNFGTFKSVANLELEFKEDDDPKHENKRAKTK